MRSGGLNLLNDGPEIVAAYSRACSKRLQRDSDRSLVFDNPDAVERVEQRADDRRTVDDTLIKVSMLDPCCRSGIETCSNGSQFTSPEHIDGGDSTASSKRIDDEIPEYKHAKASAGPITAGMSGESRLRSKCTHFAEWLAKLENLENNLKKPEAQVNRTI